MDIKVRYLGSKKFEMTARDHKVLSDQPFDNDGTDGAMTPPELFLSSLGACAAYYAVEYLKARGLPDEELEVHVSGEKGDHPVRIVSMHVDIIAPGLNQRHRDGILRAVNYCLIKNTLLVPPQIDVNVMASEKVSDRDAVLA